MHFDQSILIFGIEHIDYAWVDALNVVTSSNKLLLLVNHDLFLLYFKLLENY